MPELRLDRANSLRFEAPGLAAAAASGAAAGGRSAAAPSCGRRAPVANVRSSLRLARPRHAERTLDVAPRQEIPIHPLKLPDRTRDRRHPPRLRGVRPSVLPSFTSRRTARPVKALTPPRATATDRREHHLTQRARRPLDSEKNPTVYRTGAAVPRRGPHPGKRPHLTTLILNGPDPLGAPRAGPGCRRNGAGLWLGESRGNGSDTGESEPRGLVSCLRNRRIDC